MTAHRSLPRQPLRVLAALALAATLVPAQEPDWRLIRPSNTGVPGETLSFLSVDPDDHVWVAGRFPFWGEGGIADFDGEHWRTYSSHDVPELDQSVHDAAFAPDGTRWFATDRGLVRLADGVFTRFHVGNSPLPSDRVRALAVEASGGAVWLRHDSAGPVPAGVARFDGARWDLWSAGAVGLAPTHQLHGPVVDGAGDVWVSSAASQVPGGGVARFDGAAWTVFDGSTGQSDQLADFLVRDDAGGVWVRWWQGLMRWDGSAWVDVPDPTGLDSWSALRVRGADDIWVGTFGGQLAHWDGSAWSAVDPGWGGSSDWVLSLDVQSDDSLWLCSRVQGARRRDPLTGAWTVYSHLNTGLPDYFVNDLAVGADGDLWVASSQGGLARMQGPAATFEDATWRCFNAFNSGFEPWPWTYDQPWGNSSAQAVVAEPSGAVWTASSGVGRWDDVDWDLYVPANSDIWTQSGCDHLALDARGHLWVGYDLYGVDQFDGSSWTHHDLDDGLPGLFVRDLGVDQDGAVYVATNGGLGRYADGAWTTVATPPGLPFSMTSVEVGPAGELWIGTAGGAARRDADGWTVFTAASGALPADPVQDIAVAADGTAYVASFDGQLFPYPGGISRFDGSTWTTWTRQDSPLPHNQVTDLALDAAGNLYAVAASEGVAVLLFGDGPWTDLGGGSAGSHGTPRLTGSGALVGGAPVSLTLGDAPPGALMLAWLSLSSAPFDVFGGTLHATPFAAQFLVTADAAGSFDVTTPWPQGVPSGVGTWFQFLVQDAGAPAGLVLSNGLLASAP